MKGQIFWRDLDLEKAKIRLKEICDGMKEIKKKNKISRRTSKNITLRKLFKKYHGQKFTMNKVMYHKGRPAYGDAQIFFQSMIEESFLTGFIVASRKGTQKEKNKEGSEVVK